MVSRCLAVLVGVAIVVLEYRSCCFGACSLSVLAACQGCIFFPGEIESFTTSHSALGRGVLENGTPDWVVIAVGWLGLIVLLIRAAC